MKIEYAADGCKVTITLDGQAYTMDYEQLQNQIDWAARHCPEELWAWQGAMDYLKAHCQVEQVAADVCYHNALWASGVNTGWAQMCTRGAR
jgi:hypothetical protein